MVSYRSNFSYVDQNVRLFNDSISGNIAFGQKDKMSIETITNAAKISNSNEFIEKLEITSMTLKLVKMVSLYLEVRDKDYQLRGLLQKIVQF